MKNYNWKLLGILGSIKLIIHLLFNTTYSFHRDEYLYLSQGEHLGFGYMEVPPMIALYAKMALSFGGSLFVIRLLPTLIGVATVILLGMIIRDLGGKRWAQIFGGLAFIITPVFLRANMLFQPVAFNQFMWFLSAFMMIRLVKTENPKYWYYLGVVAGFGILTKYSIAFFFFAMLIGLVLTPQRKWLLKPQPYIAVFIALAIASPNIGWQFEHNLPVMNHMEVLRETQLVNVQFGRFMIDQVLMLFAANVVWIAGLVYLFKSKTHGKYRFLGWTFVFTIGIIAYLSGKSYYTVGAYTMLFVFGGIALEQWLKSRSSKITVSILLVTFTLPFVPYSIPVMSIERMADYCDFMKDNLGLKGPLIWEDGEVHQVPQDYADMHGWEEMVKNLSEQFHALPDSMKNDCSIYGGSYGHAGAINYYRKKYDLPKAMSFSSSFVIWAPDEADFSVQFEIDDNTHDSSSYFENIKLVGQNQHPFCRDPGYIYLKTNPKVDISDAWARLAKEEKSTFNF